MIDKKSHPLVGWLWFPGFALLLAVLPGFLPYPTVIVLCTTTNTSKPGSTASREAARLCIGIDRFYYTLPELT
jgi:hypothetical protein